MLFPYSPVPNHKLEAMQSIVDYLFNEVWCKALDEEYGLHLFEGHSILHQIMERLEILESDGKLNAKGRSYKFLRSVNGIFIEFQSLESKEALDVYKKSFYDNNCIDQLCANHTGFVPVHYSKLDTKYKALNDKLNAFFTTLYGTSGFFESSLAKEMIGSDLTSYYRDFVRHNDQGICPFCGLYPLDGEFDPTRDAFDHYLPKAKYPFNSINLRNLAPSCNKCNSGNKGEKDPLYDDQGNRRKAFYPFSLATTDLSLTIDVASKDWKNLQPNDLSIAYHSPLYQEEIETWRMLFRIDQRYKAKLCSSDAKAWLEQIRTMIDKFNATPKDCIEVVEESAKEFPFSDLNFLKKTFLDGCQRAGLFEEPELAKPN